MKKEIKEEIVKTIMEVCEKDKQLPWDKGILNSQIFFPVNHITGRRYGGINRMLLMILGRGTQEYVTFNQCKKKKGMVKKGEKAKPIIFYMPYNKKEHRAAEKGDKKEDLVPILRGFRVFEISQTTLEPKRILSTKDNKESLDIKNFVEKFANETKLEIKNVFESGKTACYIPSQHVVEISDITLYSSSDEYYSTLFHELIHSTQEAMKRKSDHSFGSEEYSKEEVVAETGAMFLCATFGITKAKNNSTVYIKSWSEKLRENPDWLISGANSAEKAVEYMLEKSGMKMISNIEPDTEEVTVDSLSGDSESNTVVK